MFDQIDYTTLELADQWILSRLSKVNLETSERYQNYALGEAAKGLYEFAWNDFCDWYVELIKRRLNLGDCPSEEALLDRKNSQLVMFKVLRDLLVMLHPLMPHLTEELWHAITGFHETKFLALDSWPKPNKAWCNQELELSFSELFDSIRLVRNLRAEAGLKPSQNAPVRFITKNTNLLELLKKAIPDIQSLTRSNAVEVVHPRETLGKSNSKSLAGVSGELEVLLPIEDLVDLHALRSRLQKDLSKAEKEIAILSGRLSNSSFIQKAPEKVISECRQKLADAEAQVDLVQQRLLGLE
jgi:valyl-tRNA synthetase